VLAFGDASSQTWGYDNADRVVTLTHVFPNAPDDLTLTYAYDPADREVSKTTPNAAYQWSPAVAIVPYAAANALNQYPSVNSYPYSYWPEGPLKENDTLEGEYDENDRLMFAYAVNSGVVDPNNYVENLIDPMGHLMYHDVHPAAHVPYPVFYHSTDGLRPETVLDWQYSQPASGSATFQGYRRYVLGPGPDERWAFIDFDADHTIYFPHTDRQGTTIALSTNGAAAAKYAYDAYGQSTAPLTEVGPGVASYAYRYTGQRLDGGTGLYDDKARFYSSALGRFYQPDQAGLDQGPNLYLYVGDDPVNRTDPTGLAPWEEYNSFLFAAMDASNEAVAATTASSPNPGARTEFGTKILQLNSGKFLYGPLVQGGQPTATAAHVNLDKAAGPLRAFLKTGKLSDTVGTVHSHIFNAAPSGPDIINDNQTGTVGVVAKDQNQARVHVPRTADGATGLKPGSYSLSKSGTGSPTLKTCTGSRLPNSNCP